MSAYQQGSTYDNEDLLVSPAVDLSKSRTLAFEQAFGPANKDMSNAAEIYTLWVSDNYSGDVATATWTQVAIEYPSESGWTFVPTSVTLPATGKNAHFAFKYKNTASDATLTWEIKNLTVK